LVVVVDEWSAISTRVQPFLADYIKRSFFPSRKICLKIGALPFLSEFNRKEDDSIIGFEPGGDIYQGVNLDDDLVFANNQRRCHRLFSMMLHKHLAYALEQAGEDVTLPDDAAALVDELFTLSAFRRLLVYSHGNARDFLTLFQKAFLFHRDDGKKIVQKAIDAAAKDFGNEKISSIREHLGSYTLLNRLMKKTLHQEKEAAFLVETGLLSSVSSLRYLVHKRLLHVWDRSYSAPRRIGVRFAVVSLDYCVIADYLSAPAYRHILKQLCLPFTQEERRTLESERQEAARREKVLRFEPPDKRSVRYKVIEAEFFVVAKPTCKACGPIDGGHPVYRKHAVCPTCGDAPVYRPDS
jgi:ribosomal protein S27AE